MELTQVIYLMVLANRFTAMIFKPIFEKYQLDNFWLAYIAWVLSGILVALTGLNLFAEYIPSVLAGQIITAVVAGGGANLLHDLTDKPEVVEVYPVGE